MPLGSNDLVLVLGHDARGMIAEMCAAAVAGRVLGPHALADRRRARETRRTPLADGKRLIADHGLALADLDALLFWLPGEPLPPASRTRPSSTRSRTAWARARSTWCRASARASTSIARRKRSRGVCDRAREHGLLVTLEYLPWAGIPDAATALAIVERSGRANAALLFDTLAHVPRPDRRRAAREDSRARGSAACRSTTRRPSPAETTSSRRRCRRGSCRARARSRVVRWLRWLDAIGSTAPIGVEVFSSALDALPPVEVGRRCGAAGARGARRGAAISSRAQPKWQT